MVNKRTIGACVAGAFFAPAGVALAQSGDDDPRVRPVVNRAILGAEGLAAEADLAQHKRLVRRHMTVAHEYADLKGFELRDERLGAQHMTNTSREVREATVDLRDDIERIEERREERRERRKERREARRAAAAQGSATTAGSSSSAGSSSEGGSSSSGGGASAGLEAIAACESGGDPGAVSSSGQYRGKYQFDRQTWQSVGGTGDPAAAPEAEQDRRAAQLQAQRGSSPWPVCGG